MRSARQRFQSPKQQLEDGYETHENRLVFCARTGHRAGLRRRHHGGGQSGLYTGTP